tara:strand:- start:14174 stop:15406 length:1233 start_codon:yes stop_codon:yes gene_type:complete
MSTTQIDLDEIASNAVTVEKDKTVLTEDTDFGDNSVEDLDLLVDPNKSLQNSPVMKPSVAENSMPSNFSSLETPVIDSNLNSHSEPKSEEKINFSMNVERNKFSPKSSTTSSFDNFFSDNIHSSQKINENNIEKQELLFKLKRLESRGIPLSNHFSSSSRLEDMREEYERIKKQRDLENSIKFQRKTMMALTSGVEFLNSKFDPFDVKLDGWSESLHDNLSDYDDVFEELHEKYKTRAKIAPELKLLMMLGGSAAMFHMTNSFFKSAMPSMDDVLKQNPDLARQFADAAVSSATQNNPGFGNVMGDMINETMNARQRNSPPKSSVIPPSIPETKFDLNNQMAGPDDQDVQKILNQIMEYRDEGKSNPVTKEPVATIPISNDLAASVEPVKRKRGRPAKPKPNTDSFSLKL